MRNSIDLAWAAGFLEGEGSFTFTNSRLQTSFICASQVQSWPLEKLVGLFGGSIYRDKRDKREGNAQPINAWTLSGPMAIGVMMTLYKLLSPVRQNQIKAVLARWKSRPTANCYKTHCPNGHKYEGENIGYYKKPEKVNYRYCKKCRRPNRIGLLVTT